MASTFKITLQIEGIELGKWSCGEGELEVGSLVDCPLPVYADGVAGRHAKLLLSPNTLQVEALDSASVTLVNGYEISGRVETPLPATVMIGEAQLHVRESSSDSVITSPEVPEAVQGSLASGVTFLPSQLSGPTGNSKKVTASPTSFRDEKDASGEQRTVTQVKYTLHGEIARGGMGRIYTGEDKDLERNVAVKISTAGDESDTRFWKEAKVLARLAHPNIVPIHATGRDEADRPFYSMKLIKGRTLQQVINALSDGEKETVKAFNREAMLTMFRKICDALAFAHAHGILHRDIKPENVMVGEFGEVLVMDWGLAKILGEVEQQCDGRNRGTSDAGDPIDGRTIEGDVLGTPQYMSPEQAAGLISQIDERSDIYSMGGLLFAMLTLRPPIEGKTLDEVLTKVRRGELSTLKTRKTVLKKSAGQQREPRLQRDERIPEALQAVILKAMAHQPESRYSSVQAFAADIEAFQNGYATKAEDAGLMRQLKLFVHRNRLASILAACFLIAAAGFVVELVFSEAAARRAAMNAILTLAESAEREQDAEEMERLLQSVTPSMRDDRWHYLNQKLDSSVLTITAPEQSNWTTILAHPTQPSEMLTVQANGWVRTLSLKTGNSTNLFKCPDGTGAAAACVSKDFTRIALGRNVGASCKITVYSLPKGEKQMEFQQPFIGWSSSGFRQSIAMSPDGKLLLSHADVALNPVEARVKVWSLENGKIVWEGGPKSSAIAEFIDSLKIRIISSDDGIQELELPSGNLIRQNAKISFPYGAQGLYSSNSNLFSFSQPVIRKLDPVSGKALFEIRQPNLKAMDFAQSLNMLATISKRSDRSAVLQFWSSGGALARSAMLLGKFKSPWRILVHHSSGELAVVQDNLMKVHKFELSKPSHCISISSLGGVMPSFHFLANATRAVRLRAGKPPAIEVLDLKRKDPEKEPVLSISNDSMYNQLLSVSKDYSTVAVSGSVTRIYIEEENRLKELFTGKLDAVPRHFALNTTGDLIWMGSAVYETTSGTLHCKIDRKGIDTPAEGVVSVKWIGPDRVAEIALVETQREGESQTFLERAIIIWDANTGTRLATIPAPDAEVLSANPSGKYLAEGGGNMRVRIHNLETGKVEKECRTHDAPITDIQWHPKGQYIVTCSEDLTVRISDFTRNMALVEELRGFERPPRRAFISPDNQKLGVASYRGTGEKVDLYEVEAFRVRN